MIQGLIKTLIIFFILFLSKFYFLDGNFLILGFLLFIKPIHGFFYLKEIQAEVLFFLFLFVVYSFGIMLFSEVHEPYFFLKFLKASILWILLCFVYNSYSAQFDYIQFKKYAIYAVLIHSLIVITCIFNRTFSESIYSITGFQSRGLDFIRSPGITISYNSTAIVHVSALFFLLFTKDLKWRFIKKLIIGLTILISLIFLGRTIAFAGIFLIALIGVFKGYKWIIILLIVTGILIPTTFHFFENNNNIEMQSPLIKIAFYNYKRLITPFAGYNEEEAIMNYHSGALKDHWYFSNDLKTFLFGNSRAGHVGLLEGGPDGNGGETNSDLGIVNSVNANGVIITFFLYFFYLSLFILCWSKKNIIDIGFLIVLSLILTLKETGFFTSHATPLLFIIFLYHKVGFQKKHSNLIDTT